ncbi:MAG: hypothetical protein IT518_20010 [Burkholderiales bacterium]|nr:hypothetical protein [Burkholderiales bacterium]
MSRELFSPMGALLSDADLARALAAIGAFYPSTDRGEKLAARVIAPDSGFARRLTAEHGNVLEFPVRVRALQEYVRDLRAWQETHPAPMPWQQCLAQWGDAVPAGTRLRFRIDLEGARRDPQAAIDLAWLARLFAASIAGVHGVYVAWPSAPLDLSWEWPLRVGVPRTPAGDAFRAALGETFANLYDLVDVDAPGRACDILLLPAGLRDAVRMALDLPGVRASAVLVAGGVNERAEQTQAWLDGLRQQFRAGAVAIASVPAEERPCWFLTLLAEISHNATLDVALLQASHGGVRDRFRRGPAGPEFKGDLIAPLVEADRAFVDRAVISEIARRIGNTAAALPNALARVAFDRSFTSVSLTGRADLTVGVAGSDLAQGADRIAWHHETGDALALADFRSRVEQAAGAALTLPVIAIGAVARARMAAAAPTSVRRMRGTRARPPQPAMAAAPPPGPAAPPSRSVLMKVLVQGARDAWTPAAGNAIDAGVNCRLDTFIGSPRAGVVAGNAPIDESVLPPSPRGHALTVVFTPLWRGEDHAFPPAQMQRIRLPETGDSDPAVFFFRAPAALDALRARVVVLFGYRVLQTLLLDCAPAQAGAGARALRLAVESLVAPDFGEGSEAPAFGAAIVVNDNPQGVPGFTGIWPDGAAFVEPEGLPRLVDSIRKELKVLNQGEGAPDSIIASLDDERVHRMLRNLAALGGELTRLIKAEPALAGVLGTEPIQVVDARRGAYLPVEFFYNGKSARPEATRCPNAVAALGDLRIHDACPNNKDAKFYCPAAFWGFSRCIERQAVGGQGHALFRQPAPGANTLQPLSKVLLAASQNVRAQDLDAADGIVKSLEAAAGSVVRAASWDDWQAKVAGEAPSLLVLLPHSLESPDFTNVAALEIGGSILASVNLDPELVTTDPARTPLVLLLGCSTALPDVPFLNFVDRFKDNGAVLVIGTIATIRGRQTTAFIKALLAELGAADGTRTFDQVFLRAKQRLLAAGDPFVLSVLAYGDSGWRIRN